MDHETPIEQIYSGKRVNEGEIKAKKTKEKKRRERKTTSGSGSTVGIHGWTTEGLGQDTAKQKMVRGSLGTEGRSARSEFALWPNASCLSCDAQFPTVPIFTAL